MTTTNDQDQPFNAKGDVTNGNKPTKVLKPAQHRYLPPDGGYGWVVVASSFFLLTLTMSLLLSFPILYIEFSRVFKQPKSVIGWVQSIHTAMTLSTGNGF